MRAREEKEKGRGKDGATRLTPRLAIRPRAARSSRRNERRRGATVESRGTGCSFHSGSRAARGDDGCAATVAAGGGGAGEGGGAPR